MKILGSLDRTLTQKSFILATDRLLYAVFYVENKNIDLVYVYFLWGWILAEIT